MLPVTSVSNTRYSSLILVLLAMSCRPAPPISSRPPVSLDWGLCTAAAPSEAQDPIQDPPLDADGNGLEEQVSLHRSQTQAIDLDGDGLQEQVSLRFSQAQPILPQEKVQGESIRPVSQAQPILPQEKVQGESIRPDRTQGPSQASTPFEGPQTVATVGIENGPSWTVHEPGASVLVQRPGDPRCAALATEWLEEKGRRGNARFVFVGRWFRLGPQGLEPLSDQAVLARRLLPDFESELARPPREAGQSKALRWLANPSSQPRSADPYLQGKETFRLTATVLSAALENDRLVVQVQVPGYQARLRHDPAPTEETGNTFERLGDLASGRLYPPDYRPHDPKVWLAGRSITLTTYRQRSDPPRRVLWIKPRFDP